ncbi:MAG: type II toxin-antitoxin system HicA family toxin [Planctomycetota bacterium]|nr:MAG: type II toxin-antitoxin system HicA family toxin [Planctomycetota bacterium]
MEEGTKHTRVFNPANELRSHVPRHGEVKPFLLRAICKQLGIPAPTER